VDFAFINICDLRGLRLLLFGNWLFVCLATSGQGCGHIASGTVDATCGWIPEDWGPRVYAFSEITVYHTLTKRGAVVLAAPVERALQSQENALVFRIKELQ